MIFFQYLLFSIALAYVCSFLFGKRKKLFFFVVSGILLTLFLGFRDIETGGIDLLRYNRQYVDLQDADSIGAAFEIREGENALFFLLLYAFAKLGWSFQTFLLVIATFSVSASMLLYYRYSKYPLLCLCMFLPICYIHLFSQLKQTIAVAIAVFAYILLRNNKTKWSYALLIVAMLFHPTAIVMLPFFFLCKFRATPKLLFFLFLGSIFVFLSRMSLGYYLTFALYNQFIDQYASRERITGMATLFVLITTLYILLMPKSQSVIKEKYLILSSYLYALIIATCIFFCASYSYAFTRLNNYYLMFLPLAISEMADFSVWKKFFGSKLPVYVIFGLIMYVMITRFLDMVVSQYLDSYHFYWMK